MITELEGHGKTYTFPCGDWLASDDEDGKTFRYLYPAGRKSSTTAAGFKGKKGSSKYMEIEGSGNHVACKVFTCHNLQLDIIKALQWPTNAIFSTLYHENKEQFYVQPQT